MSEVQGPGWCRALLGELGEVGTGATPKRGVARYFDEGTVPWVTSGAVNAGRVTEAKEFITEAAVRETNAKIFPAGSILIAMYGEGKTRGRAAELSIDAATNQALATVQLGPTASCLRRWILLQLELNYERTRFLSSGGVQPNLNLSHIRDLEMLLAPQAEQASIIRFVDEQLSRLDAAVEGLKRVQANLKRYRASVLKAAVEGRLVPTEAALAKAEGRTYEPASALLARILTERRKRWEEAELAAMKTKGTVPKDDKWKAKYQEPSPPDTKGLPELPEGWCWASVDALILGSPQNGLYLPQSEYGAGVPILRIDDFQSMTATPIAGLRCVKVDDNTASKYRLAVGDVIVNRVNSLSHLGKSVAVGAALDGALFESNMMRFTCVDPSMSRYVEVYLASDVGKARLVTNAKWAVNQASINQRDVLTTVIPLPPLREQLRVLAQVSLLLTAQGHEKSASEHAIARCSRLRQSILKWAFEGKLVDQDPNDEPASVLLERIRAERQVHTATKARNGTPPPTAPRNTDSAAASKRRTRQKARPEAARRVP